MLAYVKIAEEAEADLTDEASAPFNRIDVLVIVFSRLTMWIPKKKNERTQRL
jgi:hypothetical protein